jgi:fatty acid hydroxylase family protein
MGPDFDARTVEMARGRAVKRRNALTAAFAGGALAILAARFFAPASAPSPESELVRLAVGILAGLIYANAFEYVLHRFVLHRGEGFLDQRHALHHDSAGAPEEARYVNFARSPWVVVLVFVLNAIPVVSLEYFLRAGIATGIFVGFTIYFIAYEEIHWRIHFGRLPRWMSFARSHHMLHHGGFAGRYNVFLPLFDWIFERAEWKRRRA